MGITRKLIPVALVAAAFTASAPATGVAKGPHFEGTVVSVNREAKTFRIRDPERGTARITVTGSTQWQRIAGGFAGLRKGMGNVEAKVRRSGGKWVAWKVERN